MIEARNGGGARRLSRWAAAMLVALGAIFSGGGGAVTPAAAQDAVDLSGFDAWRDSFRPRALAAGISADVFDAAFDGVEPDPRIIERDRNQSEFSSAIWEYLGSAVSDTRVANGAAALQAQTANLRAIEARYGVPPEIVVAIWGVESAFGAVRGDNDIITALATLAFEGRRRTRFEAELIAALRILQAGDVAPRDMRGSWAGASGHTQFMPSSFLELAVDFDGDGRRDIWSDNPVDALASTAQYLSARGWRVGEPWGVWARLPAEFDYRLLDGGPRPTLFWAERGVTLADGGPLPAGIERAAILLPAGAEGPAFLVFDNFRVLMTYNPSSAYALAVALLSERVAGAPPPPFQWPTHNRPLPRAEREELQEKLTALGFDTGGVDGIIGANSRAAIRRFQAANGLIADGYASQALLAYVRETLSVREAPVLRPIESTAPLGEADIREMQIFLQALGYYRDGEIDGKVGPMTRAALTQFVDATGGALSPEPNRALLDALREAARGG